MKNTLRQIILLRKDLLQNPNWTFGAVIAQAVHAATECLSYYSDDDCVKEYLNERSNMTTIILALKDQQELTQCHEELACLNADHVIWNEMPENIPTAIALKPYTKHSPHQSYLKRFPLFS